ncbi:MAG TPA: DinB family protein [Thermoanaerobaculia bacterium]
MRHLLRILVVSLVIPSAAVIAEENPLTTYQKGLSSGIQKIVLASAELMPEEKYGFRPTEDVRTFGQLVGHVAESQYYFCASVKGEKNPGLRIEKTATTKAELTAALGAAFAYCNEAYAGLTDAAGAERVTFMGSESPKLGVLSVNNVHTALHYGNLIVYLRLNGIVPPSSDPELMKSLRK